MNNVFKFHSGENFEYNKWLRDRATEAVTDSLKTLARKNISVNPEEKNKLVDQTMKNMTLHFYYAGRVTTKDIANLRPKVKSEEKKA